MIGVRGQARFDDRSATTVETIDGRPYPGPHRLSGEQQSRALRGEIDVVYTWVDGSDATMASRLRRLVGA